MNPELLSAIVDADPNRVCDEIVKCSPKELKDIRKERPKLIQEQADGNASYKPADQARIIHLRHDLMQMAGLFGATKSQLKQEREWLHRVNNLSELETIENCIVDVIRRTEWPLANDFAEACVPTKEWWEHCWTVAYCLVKEGLAEVPQVPGWLMWMPHGVARFAHRGPQHHDPIRSSGHHGYEILQREREIVIPLVEAFFKDPMAGKLASTYSGQMSGVGAEVPRPGEIKEEYQWRSESQRCIGLSLVQLAEHGGIDQAHVAELFFTAMANVVNNKSGKWLADLLDWVCSDEELLERERNAAGRVTVSFLVSHENASVVKWALGRLRPLVNSGDYPLGEFAAAVGPALPTLAKGTAKKVIDLMAKRLAKDGGAALPVARAAVAGLLQADAKVQDAALIAIEKSGAVSDAEVQAALADADSVIQPSVRKRYDEIVYAGGAAEQEAIDTAEPPAPSEAAELQTWPASFDPANVIAPIDDVDTLIAEAAACFARPDSCLAVMRLLDAMARFNGRLPDDIRDRLGSLKDGLGTEPGGLALDTLRREGWSKVVKIAKKNTEWWEFGPIADIGPVGSETYSEEDERTNLSNWWVFHQKGRGIEKIGADFKGTTFVRTLSVLMRAWLGIPVNSFRTRIDVDKAREEYEKWAKKQGGSPHPFFDPPVNPPTTRWFNDILARIQSGEPFVILSTPTHAPWWIEPMSLVDRIARCEADGVEFSEVDAAMAVLRLAPVGREEALAAAKKLKSAAAAALCYALGGPKPRKKIGGELLACASHVRTPPTYTATCAVGEFHRRSGHRYDPPVAGMPGVEVTVTPGLDANANVSLLPAYVHCFHRTRLHYHWDGQPNEGAEPMLLEWLCSVLPGRLDLAVPYLVSIYTSVGDSDSAYGRALDALLLSLFDGKHGPIPNSAYFAVAYAMGRKRASARDHAADALIRALPYAGFDAAAVGRHLGDLLAYSLFTTNNPLKVIGVVASEGGAVVWGLARLLEATLVRLTEPPRGINKIVDVLTELRHAHRCPMSDELATWAEAQPKKGAMGRAVKGLLATR